VPAEPEFLGHYRVVRKLGEGGMGEVYLAHDSTLERPVAIKLITGFRTDHDTGRRRLLREAQAAAALDHPNICAVHEIRSEGDRSFIVMQFCDGETLAARLERGPLGADEAAELLGQVADALAFAHRAGLVHRDIKPQNIMISPRGRVKVLDFGLAKVAGLAGQVSDDTPTETVLTFHGSPVGTASYMAPEQIKCEAVDSRADLFAMGVVMYECLTGRRPFEGRSTYEILDAVVTRDPPPPQAVNPAVPAAFGDLCMRLLAKRPDERLQSAEELREHLAALRRGGHHGVAAVIATDRQPARADSGGGRVRPAWTLLAAGAAVLAAVLGVAWLLWWRSTPLPEPSPQARRWHDAGVHALRGGAYQDAMRALRQAVQVDERYVMAWARLAEAQAELDDMRSAPQSLNRMWQLVPDRSRLPAAERLQLEAIAAMVTRRGGEAVRAYQELATLGTGAPHVFVDLGRAWEVVPDYARAQEAYTQALERDPQSAVALLRRATLRGQRGDHASALADFAQAERLYGAASDLEGQSELLLERGELHLDLQQLPQARADAQRAVEIATAARLEHQRVRGALLLARVAVDEGKIGDAERLAREAVDRSAGFESLQTQALVDFGNVFLAQSRYKEAEARFREAVAVGTRFGAERATARAKLALASVLVSVADGRVAEGQALAKEAYAYYDRNNVQTPKRQALQIFIRAADTTGDLDAADRAARELLAMGTASDDRVTIAAAADALGTSLARRGQLPQALEQTERALQLYEEQGSELAATYTRLRRAELLARLGHFADARDQLRLLADALAASKALGEFVSAYLEGVQAKLAFNEGRSREAAAFSCREPAGADDRVWQVDMLLLCAAARAQAGDGAGAERAARPALSLARTLDDRVTLAQALAAGAELAQAAGLHESALAQGREAAAVFDRLQADEPAWRLHVVLARAASAAGRPDEAQRFAEAARAAFERLRQSWPPDAFSSYLTTGVVTAAGGPPRGSESTTTPQRGGGR
jgi:eukaryotic-like serine/threonine-protein kinase